MKVLHTADWHIGQFKGPVVDGVNLRSQDTVKCLEYMVQVATEEKPDIVCVSGDIFHQEQIGPVRYSDEMINATNIITSLARFAKYVIVMRGTPNHDGGGQFRVLNRMLLNVKNVSVVTEPVVIKTPLADIACIPGFDKQEFRSKFPGLSADDENITWTKYISDMVLALRAGCEKTPILMAHYTVPGCNMESGQTSFFTNFEPVIPREVLMTARYEAVLLGHIHRPQIIEGFDNVFYSGAINAMNFNDEGQDRGFWIHEFNEKGTLIKGHRYTTPYRQFCTITWDSDEVGNYIREGIMYLHRTGIPEGVADKIVRVRYSCTSEQKKALNIPLLQKNLYEVGAFYVADIEAESTIDITNRGLLSEESDPRLNLKKWLNEKAFKNPDKIVELAEPIIAEAIKQSTTAEIHGVFKPVSISVRNYRNYKEESFDFSDISFCTINNHHELEKEIEKYTTEQLSKNGRSLLGVFSNYYNNYRYANYIPGKNSSELRKLFISFLKKQNGKFNFDEPCALIQFDAFKRFYINELGKLARYYFELIEHKARDINTYTYEIDSYSNAARVFLSTQRRSFYEQMVIEQNSIKELLLYMYKNKRESGAFRLLNDMESLEMDDALVNDYLADLCEGKVNNWLIDYVDELYEEMEDIKKRKERKELLALIGNRSVLFDFDDFEDDENESYHRNMFESDDIEGGENL